MASPPVIRIDLGSPVPVYRQVAAAVRALLVSGELGPGDQLPTIRELALDLGVHRNTIAEAYRLLAGEGWLELRRRHGARVLAREVPIAGEEATEGFGRRLREMIAEALAAGVEPGAVAASLRGAARQLEDARSASGD